MNKNNIPTWELLQKQMAWEQLKFVHNMKVLDFGSGSGMMSQHLAKNNDVIAIEPDKKMIEEIFVDNNYKQIIGDINELKEFDDECFDVVLCHNVLEYATGREEIINEFSRVLKRNGYLSILKHNKSGRVMQMVVLLNNFEHASELLEGKDGHAERFGKINYYEDKDIIKWCDKFEIEKILGMRAFWHLQQNQEIQIDEAWRKQMKEIELKASELEEYKAIAMFHHLILKKV